MSEISTRIDVYPANLGGARPAMLVLPGGGYAHHAAHEGEPVAVWLNSLGITAFVLRYRVFPDLYPAPLEDGWAAMAFIRAQAASFEVDPSRIGVLGFSAGGHLAALLAAGVQPAAASNERRPDLAVLCYPVISLGSRASSSSASNLLGASASEELRRALSVEHRVDGDTTPCFVWHTSDDAGVNDSLILAGALTANGVPVELHVFPHGRHGLGLARDEPRVGQWTKLCADWLQSNGWMPSENPSSAIGAEVAS